LSRSSVIGVSIEPGATPWETGETAPREDGSTA
jgi:hypothetical protein